MPLKDELLKALETHRDTPLSGQALAKAFAVSRTAVWKAVNELKTQGYAILSAPNRGYQLAANDDHLSSYVIQSELEQALPVYALESVDSTLSEAKRRYADGGERFLVVSDTQSSGRGRRGKRFFSPRAPDCT